MSCTGVPDTAFFSRAGWLLSPETTPTTDGNKANCWTSGYFKQICPSGWKYVKETSDGCSATTSRSLCSYASYPTDDATKARCCLGLHRVGAMSDGGSYPGNAKPCPPNYCEANKANDECVKSLENYCTTQYPIDSPDNEQCWRWAKAVGSPTLDTFCKDDGDGNGSALSTNKQCKEWINDRLSYGKMDNSFRAYCSTDLAKKNAKNGEKTCSCFRETSQLPADQLRLINLGAPLGCWDSTCREYGYYTQNDLERVKNCGQFCGSANVIGVTGNVEGNVALQQTCSANAGTAQKTAEAILKEQEEAKTAVLASGTPSGSKKSTIIILSTIGVVLLLIVIGGVAYAMSSSNEDEQEAMQYGPMQYVPTLQPDLSMQDMSQQQPYGMGPQLGYPY